MSLIARALAAQPQILILDEPESNLDFRNQLIVLETLSQLSAEGITCIFNTHYPEHALGRANKSLILGKDGNGAHFDSVMAGLLAENETYGASYTEDLTKTDALGTSVETRVAMYNPLYYLCDYYDGYQTSDVAQHWRIRTGIEQGDTALTTEINLALALENYGADVDFETVWGQGHTEAERTGGSSENFIAWVNALYN